VASALDAAHAVGLVHRDVKPANILVDARPGRPDHVYLSDFGVSKGAVSSVSLTGTGQYLGTPDYSAPEQIEGRAVDGRTDQYALACVAYQMLAGAVPFERDQGVAVLLAHLSAPPPSLCSRRPDLPEAADEVLARALAKAPEERYGTCRDFADALREALGLAPYYPGGSASGYPQTERAAAQRRQDVEQLQAQLRDRTAAQDWDAVVAASHRLAELDPAVADPDGLASTARQQITRRQEAERAATHEEDAALASGGRLTASDPGAVGSAKEEITRTAADHDRQATADRQQLSHHKETGEDAPLVRVDKTQAGGDENREVRRRGRRSARLYSAIVGAIAVASLLVVSLLLATNSPRHQMSTSSSQGTTSRTASVAHRPTTTPPTTKSPTAAVGWATALIARLPPVIRNSGCAQSQAENTNEVFCPGNLGDIPALGGRSYSYTQYSSLSALRRAFRDLLLGPNNVSSNPPPRGNCLSGTPNFAWQDYSVGTHHGQISCEPGGDRSGALTWSDESTLIIGQQSIGDPWGRQSYAEGIQVWKQALQVAPAA
jgi:hypothetical protein